MIQLMTPDSKKNSFNKNKRIKKPPRSTEKSRYHDVLQLLKPSKENTQIGTENIHDKYQIMLKDENTLRDTPQIEKQVKITDQRGGFGIPAQRLGIFNFKPQSYQAFIQQSKKKQNQSKPKKKKNQQKFEKTEIQKVKNDPTQTKLQRCWNKKIQHDS